MLFGLRHIVFGNQAKKSPTYCLVRLDLFLVILKVLVCHLADTARAFVSLSPDCSSLFCILSMLTALINVISAAEIGLLPASLQGSHNGYLVYAYTSRPIGQSSYDWLDGCIPNIALVPMVKSVHVPSLALSVNIQQVDREIFSTGARYYFHYVKSSRYHN